jgi:hypothetical protein
MSGRTTAALRRLTEADQADLARRLDRVFAAVAGQAANNPDFAAALIAAIGDAPAPKPGTAMSRPPAVRKGHRRAPGPFNPYAVLAADGEEGLRKRLADCDAEELKNIIAEHGMDHDRLAMKWKTTDRLTGRIVETTISQTRKGEAFR